MKRMSVAKVLMHTQIKDYMIGMAGLLINPMLTNPYKKKKRVTQIIDLSLSLIHSHALLYLLDTPVRMSKKPKLLL